MIRKVILVAIVLIFAFSTDVYSQIFVTKSNGKKIIHIDKKDRIKLSFKTDKKINGIYTFLLYGKYSNSRYGELLSYSDSVIVVRSRNRWLVAQTDTIPVNKIIAINKYNRYVRLATFIGARVAIVLTLTSTGAFNSPFIILYLIGSIVGISIIDDLSIYPRKNIEKKKWSIIVKDK